MNNWQNIWTRRVIQVPERLTLEDLIRLDGFDTGAGAISLEAWQAYVMRRADEMGIQAGWSVFEIGCGAGAFLWPLHQRGCRVAGIDYSAVLIEAAQQTIPDGQWQIGGAHQLVLTPRSYNVLVANSVFQYFPDADYAQHVLKHMLQTAQQTVAILDVPDARLQEVAQVARRQSLGEEQYNTKYQGLGHQTYLRAWFQEITPDGWQVQTSPQDITAYGNSKYRFNVILQRT